MAEHCDSMAYKWRERREHLIPAGWEQQHGVPAVGVDGRDRSVDTLVGGFTPGRIRAKPDDVRAAPGQPWRRHYWPRQLRLHERKQYQ